MDGEEKLFKNHKKRKREQPNKKQKRKRKNLRTVIQLLRCFHINQLCIQIQICYFIQFCITKWSLSLSALRFVVIVDAVFFIISFRCNVHVHSFACTRFNILIQLCHWIWNQQKNKNTHHIALWISNTTKMRWEESGGKKSSHSIGNTVNIINMMEQVLTQGTKKNTTNTILQENLSDRISAKYNIFHSLRFAPPSLCAHFNFVSFFFFFRNFVEFSFWTVLFSCIFFSPYLHLHCLTRLYACFPLYKKWCWHLILMIVITHWRC